MKKFTTLKTLLVGLLALGATSAWARTVTYDFKSAVSDGGIPESSLTKATSAGTNNSTDIFYPEELTTELQNRFAFQYREKNNKTNAWSINKSRGGLWSNCASGVDDYFSIFNLKAGDVVTVTLESGEIFFSTTSANATYDNEGTATTPAQWEPLVSGKPYTIIADGKLDLQAKKFQNGTRGHCIISKIEIVTTDEETIETAPTIAVTGANGGAREITITSFNTSAGNSTTTFYSLDGTDPTASSTEYTAAFNVSSTDDTDEDGFVIVKAISYKTGGTTVASEVTTLSVPVGTSVSLNAPVITLTSFTTNGGALVPTYSFSSDQSNVIGSPVVNYSYSFNGGVATNATSYSSKAAGSITVTVTADGYAPNSTTQDIVGGDFLKTYSFDAISDVTVDTSTGTWDQANNVSGAQWTYTDLTNCAYNLREGITLSGFRYARATTKQTKQGFYARGGGSATIGFSLNSTELIVFTMLGGDVVIANGTSNSQTFGQYSNVRAIDIYTPASDVTISATIGSNGYTTFAYPYNSVEIPTGVNAYTAKVNEAGTAVNFTKIEGTAIPANTGVLLEGTPGDITLTVVDSATPLTDNDFIAGTGAAPSDNTKTYFAMVKDSDPLAFGKIAAGVVVPANKAYLAVAAGAFVPESARLTVTFDGEATGIKTVENAKAGKAIYNLNGQRVDKAQKGLYIVNGKKTIVK